MDAANGGEDVRENTVAFGIPRNLIEQDGAVAGLALVEVDDPADLLLAIGAGDVLDFAMGLHGGDPAPQVLLAQSVLLEAHNLTVVLAHRIDRCEALGAQNAGEL